MMAEWGWMSLRSLILFNFQTVLQFMYIFFLSLWYQTSSTRWTLGIVSTDLTRYRYFKTFIFFVLGITFQLSCCWITSSSKLTFLHLFLTFIITFFFFSLFFSCGSNETKIEKYKIRCGKLNWLDFSLSFGFFFRGDLMNVCYFFLWWKPKNRIENFTIFQFYFILSNIKFIFR